MGRLAVCQVIQCECPVILDTHAVVNKRSARIADDPAVGAETNGLVGHLDEVRLIDERVSSLTHETPDT